MKRRTRPSFVLSGSVRGVPLCDLPGLGYAVQRELAQTEKASKMDKTIVLQPIGVIHSPYTEAKGTPIQGILGNETEAWIELVDRYVDGLKDLKVQSCHSPVPLPPIRQRRDRREAVP